jgi:RNA polymerase sigma-70 factor (ECF subfamily)
MVEGRPLENVGARPASPGSDSSGGPDRSGPYQESELLARARGGDVAAYETLVEEYQTIAFRTAYVITGSAAEAEEAAQDGFVKAYRALGGFRLGAAFRPWLLTIVANEARNRRRSARRRAELVLRAAEDPSPGGAAPSPEAALLASEQRRDLLDAVRTLSKEEQLVVACRYFLGLTEEETAAVIGRPQGTVKSRSARALARLRERMEGYA